VLRAEPHPVDTAETGDFHDPWVGKVDLEQRGNLALAEKSENAAGT
jgi:hypothetical protein